MRGRRDGEGQRDKAVVRRRGRDTNVTLLVMLSAHAPRPIPDPLHRAPALQVTWGLRCNLPPPPALLSVACLALVSNMSLPPIPTNPVDLSTLRRPARRLVDAVFAITRHGQHGYAAFWARVDADHPARDNGWDHFVDLCLRRVLVNPAA